MVNITDEIRSPYEHLMPLLSGVIESAPILFSESVTQKRDHVSPREEPQDDIHEVKGHRLQKDQQGGLTLINKPLHVIPDT